MKNIETEIIIESDIATVWNILTDFENYPNWNPFIKSIKGEKMVGQQLTVVMSHDGLRAQLQALNFLRALVPVDKFQTGL